MPDRPFAQIDVFTATPGFGNPVAVVLDGAGLDEEAMQRFARWTNLSETTFVLPPTPRSAPALRGWRRAVRPSRPRRSCSNVPRA